MEILFLIIGILAGIILAWLYFSKKIEKITKELTVVNEEKIKISANLDAYEKNKLLFENQLNGVIESYVFNAMKTNNENFINLARQTLEKYFSVADNKLKDKTLEIEKIILPLQKSLDVYDKKISEFQLDTSKNIGNIKLYLSELSKMQQELTKETHSLAGALKSPRIRGRWGEIGLRRIVEFSGLNQYCDFSEQVHNSAVGQRPDLIIHLPESRKIIVDSKLPLEAYLESVETENPDEQVLKLKKHLAAVKDNIKRLSSKDYSKNYDDSIDFVIMYIEIEPALAAALAQDHQLINNALSSNIILATPTTFIALLQTVAYGWRQYKMSENANSILLEAQKFYNRTAVFTEHFDKIGKTIDNLVETFNQATGSWTRRMEPSLKRMEELGVSSSKKSTKEIQDINKTTRLS